jgi:hypothetical protein
VIGLDVGLVLAERGYGSHITFIAEHLPGDTSINYTSPWFVTTSKKKREAQRRTDHQKGRVQISLQYQAAMQMPSDGTDMGMNT